MIFCGDPLLRKGRNEQFNLSAKYIIHIDIPAALAELAETLSKMPSWAELCRQREEAAKNLKKQQK